MEKKKNSTTNINNINNEVLELKKHVAVIHSNNKLSLVQRKIANALLYHAYPNLLTLPEHQIHIVKLCNLIGYDSKDYQSIKRALVNLLSTVLEWNLVDGERLDSNGVWNASAIIADASIEGPICTYSYSNKMRELLYRPNIYGRLDMKIQAEFQSAYGLALYENCNRFQDIGKTPWFDIAKFRKLMGVEGSKYKIFRDFKTRVLDKAVDEVNKYSTLKIMPQVRKIGRQVAYIQFLINPLTNITNINITNINSAENISTELPALLNSQFGFSSKQIKKIMSTYEEAYIREKINIVSTSASYQDGKIKNISSYFMSALKEDYQKPIKQTSRNSPSSDSFAVQALKKQEQLQREQFREHQNKILLTLFKNNQEDITFMQKFKKFLGNGIYQDIFSRDGFKNPLIQNQLITYLWQTNHPLLAKLPTYESWAS